MRRRQSFWLSVVVGLVAALLGSAPVAAGAGFDPAAPVFGQPHKVTYDRYSLMIDGKRLSIWSGEFHMFRLPSPRLWLDVLQKLKAAGYNTVSLYFSWQYHSSAPDAYDFSGVRDLGRLLSETQQAGLYVIVRPGPYINAELDAGGFPGWETEQLGAARTPAPDYVQASEKWLSEVDRFVAPHQITRGGNVIAYQIENELLRSGDNDPYMEELVNQVHADGIDVPTTHNEFGVESPTWLPITQLNGADEYPQGFDCSHPTAWSSGNKSALDSYSTGARLEAGPSAPEFVPEFQGGSFDPWGGPGYAKCYRLTDGSYQKVLGDSFTAQGVTMRNAYMAYGGTSWGWQAVPTDYTSYDYGAAIDEARELTPKLYAVKLMAMASDALPELAQTISAGTPKGSNSDLLYAQRDNPQTGTQFIFLRHSDPTSTATASTTLSLSTADGSYPTVPQQPGTAITVHGRDMKMLVADLSLGPEHLVYSTAQLMTRAAIGRREAVVFYAAQGDAAETVLRYPVRPRVRVLEGRVATHWDAGRHDLRLNLRVTGLSRVLIHGAHGDLLVVLDTEGDAGRIWLTQTRLGPVLSYGPYLVRAAAAAGGRLAMTGDTSASFPRAGQLGGATGTSAWSGRLSRPAGPTRLQILAASRPVHSLSWNGRRVRTVTRGGLLTASLAGPPAVRLPRLGPWRFHAEAPEAQPGFDDSGWTKADHTTTHNLVFWTAMGTPEPILFMDDYGFHYGNVWYRGHFTATGSETSLSLSCATGGPPAVCSAWLDGHFLGTWTPGANSPTTDSFSIPRGLLHTGQPSVISVLVENEGHPEDFATSLELQKQPHGLISASLHSSSPAEPGIAWRIQGDLGGEHPADRLHGPLNNGGLFGERMGWYEPGYRLGSDWQRVSLPDRWSARNVPPGVGWYHTTFRLNLPRGVDVPVGLRISDQPSYAYEALIFVNGWMMGRYANNLGPQHLFYLPAGPILNEHGRNVVAIAVLSHGAGGSGGGLGRVSLQAYGRYRGLDLSPPRP